MSLTSSISIQKGSSESWHAFQNSASWHLVGVLAHLQYGYKIIRTTINVQCPFYCKRISSFFRSRSKLHYFIGSRCKIFLVFILTCFFVLGESAKLSLQLDMFSCSPTVALSYQASRISKQWQRVFLAAQLHLACPLHLCTFYELVPIFEASRKLTYSTMPLCPSRPHSWRVLLYFFPFKSCVDSARKLLAVSVLATSLQYRPAVQKSRSRSRHYSCCTSRH